jgi:hypothetical protein
MAETHDLSFPSSSRSDSTEIEIQCTWWLHQQGSTSTVGQLLPFANVRFGGGGLVIPQKGAGCPDALKLR